MKKHYDSPSVVMELFALTQEASGCTGVQIGSIDAICVMADGDSTDTMVDFAADGGFLNTDVCADAVPSPELDALCYHTSSAMAFTS